MVKQSSDPPCTKDKASKNVRPLFLPPQKPPQANRKIERTFRDPAMRELFESRRCAERKEPA